MNKKLIPIVVTIFLFVMSCGVFEADTSITSSNFPMKESWSSKFDGAVYKLGVANDWIVVGQSNEITAIDTGTGKTMWKTDLQLDLDSLLLISNDELVAASSSQLFVINKTGEKIHTIDLQPKQSTEFVARYADYVFVYRRADGVLEVYSIQNEKLAWDIITHRGGVTVNFDPSTNTVFITSSSFVSANNITDGTEVWKINAVARAGIWESGILFYHWEVESKKLGYISAIDAQNSNLLWEIEMPLEIQDVIYDLSICNDYLIANTNFGIIVFDKKDGNELWRFNAPEFHYSSPVCMNKTLYARGVSTSKMFTFSLDGGYYLGYLNLGSPSLLGVSHPDYDMVYKSGNILIFPYNNTVYAYSQ